MNKTGVSGLVVVVPIPRGIWNFILQRKVTKALFFGGGGGAKVASILNVSAHLFVGIK